MPPYENDDGIEPGLRRQRGQHQRGVQTGAAVFTQNGGGQSYTLPQSVIQPALRGQGVADAGVAHRVPDGMQAVDDAAAGQGVAVPACGHAERLQLFLRTGQQQADCRIVRSHQRGQQLRKLMAAYPGVMRVPMNCQLLLQEGGSV